MPNKQAITEEVLYRGLSITKLLDEAEIVGGIYTMGYDECSVLTNDLWKKRAGGIPQHCFLLATAMTKKGGVDEEDEEIILLRVTGPAPLPAESELVELRSDAMREMVVEEGKEKAAKPSAVIDVLTRNEIQFSALKAKILGTFYDDTDPEGNTFLKFGSDIESFYSASKYKVYKPYGKSLSIISGYCEVTRADEQEAKIIQIGTVRYSSTVRRQKRNQNSKNVAVPVKVNVADFISLKTSVFGMTRKGKSNTMKTIASAICQYAAETGESIGQLIFDPAAEYAEINPQDKTALSEIGEESVTIFKYGADGSNPRERPLRTNFFNEDLIDAAWETIYGFLRERSQATDYLRSFLAADVRGPDNPDDDRSAYNRARRRRAALYATLLKVGFNPPRNFRFPIVINDDVLRLVNEQLEDDQNPFTKRGGSLRLDLSNLQRFWDALIEARKDNSESKQLKRWIDPELDAILKMYKGSVGSGFRLLEPLRPFHSLSGDRDYAEEVLEELIAGKLVIINLALGTEGYLKFCAERIINFILRDAARRFREGEEPHKIQIYVEEAHKLFKRDKKVGPEEEDPYVRLAKEAAKFKIGLIYATQEVSSVDPLILSNTSNWIVTHLNNHSEVKELSKYYDFQDFAELTLRSEDIGFARIKTNSNRYIIPTQIDLFSPEKVEAVRKVVQDSQA